MPQTRKNSKYPVKGLDRHGRKWRWRRTVDGTPVRVVFDAESEQDAIAQVLEFEKAPHLLISKKWERELELHLNYAARTKDLSKHYLRDRKQTLTKAADDMGIENPDQLTESKIRKWLSDVLTKTDRPATRNAYLIHMRQFTKWLTTHDRLYLDPAKDIHAIKVDFTPRNVFFESHQMRKLIDSAVTKGDTELELILLLASECGMRHGEISAARADWVDLKNNAILIPAVEKDATWSRKGTTGRRRPVVIEMVKELRQWFKRNGVPSPYLLKPKQPWGKQLYRYDFKRKVMTHFRNNGFPNHTIHDMRRSFGSNRVSAGLSIEQVANWMGIHPNTAWKYYARFVPSSGEIELGSAAASKKIPAPPPSIKERIQELNNLHDEKLINDKEYRNLKKKLLEKI